MVAKLRINIDGLNQLNKNLSQKWVTKVGILGDKNNRNNDKETNSLIGAVHEFGSLTKNIPARSWLKQPLIDKKNQLEKEVAGSISFNIAKPDGKKKIFEEVGIIAEQIIQKAFETKGYGKWEPNSKKTVARKGSDQPLVDTGQLRRAVTSKAEVVK
jgi:phage gpG-like protein